MIGATHAAIGALAGIGVKGTTASIGAGVIGSLLPDVDKKNTTIGNWLGFLALPFRLIFKHRGGTHTLLSCLLFSSIFFIIFKDLFLTLSFFAGFFLHLLADGFTATGVKPFLPFSDYKIFELPKWATFKVNGHKEYLLLVVLILGLAMGGLK